MSRASLLNWGQGPKPSSVDSRKEAEQQADETNVWRERESEEKRKDDARLLPPLVVYEKVWADAREFGVGFVPHLGF
jgi:hypothetical protein